ncbi:MULTISPECIES: antibiotic biosynthesis monooxygenase family protein [Paraburkholderia]|uniref:antibiotic biosynthesis monooxygenase family protein n=1 Tax=Paraburkholderia TaxID=1822464 RepID=UPI000B3FB21C|nr:antibiotic biosynthesis monooxygenase [Paraburkholderia caledonica]
MFSVLFEVQPRSDKWETYLGYAKLLKPELEQINGFVDNIRYRSLTREGWLLSLSNWRDEKALVRWRTQETHHGVQEKGRFEVFNDYHLRVGQLTRDTHLPDGHVLKEQRLDETQTGDATTVLLINARRDADWVKNSKAKDVAQFLGLKDDDAVGLMSWDVFDAVLSPGDIVLLAAWRDQQTADAFSSSVNVQHMRMRAVRIVRDYGMYDRREAPQYYPEARRSVAKGS